MAGVVIAFIPSSESADRVVGLAQYLQRDRKISFLVSDPENTDEALSNTREAIEKCSLQSWEIKRIESVAPLSNVLAACRSAKAELLVTADFNIASEGRRAQTSRELVRSAPCRVIKIVGSNPLPNHSKSLLVLANGGPHDVAAIETGIALSKPDEDPITIASVEPDSGAKAELAGRKAVLTLLHDASLEESDFNTKVVVDNDQHSGIRRCVADHDYVITGSDNFEAITEAGIDTSRISLLLVKRNPPLRLKSLPDWIPRINPHDHADLLQDLRYGSKWRTDFVAMLGLAASIASLGMMQNSPAVVIGSMLLAPLMTPMIGLGLAIAQANASMARTCSRSILYGILLTLCVSSLLGIVTPVRETLSPEILSRGTPNLLDLLIAIFAAVAATTAMARPNISGAIAGVAIATALVPPLCAVGLSLTRGGYDNALGAMSLFLTNLLAIIVTSSFTFSVLGISAERSKSRAALVSILLRWTLVVLLLVLAGPLSYALVNQLDKGRPQSAVYPVTRAVARAIQERVDQDEGIHVAFMGRSAVVNGVVIHLAAEHKVADSLGEELRTIVQNEMNDPEMAVYVICLSGQWLSTPDEP